MTPQQKRLKTIKKKYGSVSNMLASRDVRDLILGGYNGGIRKVKKGYGTWEKKKLKAYVATRQRDKSGRFVSDSEA